MQPGDGRPAVELDVAVDAGQLQRLLSLAGLAGEAIPASYVLCWLAHDAIRERLLSQNPAECLPVFSRHLFQIFEPLAAGEHYRLTADFTQLPALRHPAS